VSDDDDASRHRALTGRRLAARLDPDVDLGLRLTLAVVAGFVLLVPFALGLLAVTDGWHPLRRLDLDVANDLHTPAAHSHALVRFLELVSDIFSPTSWELLALVIALALFLRRMPRLAIWLLVTVGLTDPLDALVKEAVGRHRPVFDHPVLVLSSFSFPSGHAFGSLVAVGALLLAGLPAVPRRGRPWLIALGGVIVLLVGYARVGLGVHYVSDVVGGWLLGVAWLAATTAAFRAWRHALRRPDRPLHEGLEPQAPEPRSG
jgi:undecaprenyl-diphosphatase